MNNAWEISQREILQFLAAIFHHQIIRNIHPIIRVLYRLRTPRGWTYIYRGSVCFALLYILHLIAVAKGLRDLLIDTLIKRDTTLGDQDGQYTNRAWTQLHNYAIYISHKTQCVYRNARCAHGVILNLSVTRHSRTTCGWVTHWMGYSLWGHPILVSLWMRWLLK